MPRDLGIAVTLEWYFPILGLFGYNVNACPTQKNISCQNGDNSGKVQLAGGEQDTRKYESQK